MNRQNPCYFHYAMLTISKPIKCQQLSKAGLRLWGPRVWKGLKGSCFVCCLKRYHLWKTCFLFAAYIGFCRDVTQHERKKTFFASVSVILQVLFYFSFLFPVDLRLSSAHKSPKYFLRPCCRLWIQLATNGYSVFEVCLV